MSRNGKEKKRERKRKRENRSICEFTKAEPCRATVFCLILLPMMLMFPYKMLYHQSFLIDFSNFRSQPTDLEKAIEYVKSSEYIKYMGRGNPASYKLLLFTVCQSGHGAYRKHGDPGMLCVPWCESKLEKHKVALSIFEKSAFVFLFNVLHVFRVTGQ